MKLIGPKLADQSSGVKIWASTDLESGLKSCVLTDLVSGKKGQHFVSAKSLCRVPTYPYIQAHTNKDIIGARNASNIGVGFPILERVMTKSCAPSV